MKKVILFLLLSIYTCVANAQFPPPAGQPGTTAIYKDSSVFVAWANGCSIVRGYQDISNSALGYASHGDSTMGTDVAGANGVVSLGDGGHAILTFANPITDGNGWDFAVFENGFSDTFLELAFVEVSSDGINYYRFPATSNTQNTVQLGNAGSIDATQIDNLAGKYRALYGTPFDLQELSGQAGLDINAITHVKVVDVVGSIQPSYATYDQYTNIINDPWSTPFASSGFDLDAVGVINSGTVGLNDLTTENNFQVYPNPAKETVHIQNNTGSEIEYVEISNSIGQVVKSFRSTSSGTSQQYSIDDLEAGLYYLNLYNKNSSVTKKLIIRRD